MTPMEIKEWFNDMMEERECEPATVNRYKAAMSKMFKAGVGNRRVTQNPARLVPAYKESAGRIRFLTDDGEKRFRATLVYRPASTRLAAYWLKPKQVDD